MKCLFFSVKWNTRVSTPLKCFLTGSNLVDCERKLRHEPDSSERPLGALRYSKTQVRPLMFSGLTMSHWVKNLYKKGYFGV